MSKFLMILTILNLTGLGYAHAHLPLRGKNFYQIEMTQPEAVDFAALHKKYSQNLQDQDELTSKDIAMMIPTNMQETSDQGEVLRHIQKQSLKSFMNSKYVKQTALAKTFNKVKESTKMDMTVGAGKAQKANPTAQDQKTEHRIRFDVQALDSNATIAYKGYFDTKVQYKVNEQKLAIALSEKVGDQSSIDITHDNDHNGSTQWIRFSTNW